jgi:VCBS repeat-containing protein
VALFLAHLRFPAMRPRQFLVVALAILALGSPAQADDVTVSGNVAFSALDGSVLDHDGVTNGVFTVSDGDLTVLGTVNCNDDGPGNASACAMRFAVSGNMTIISGGALYAENRSGSGSGGNITLVVGRNLLLQSDATLSSGAEGNDPGGNIAIQVAGTTTLEARSIVSSASKGGRAGAIALTADGPIEIHGLVASGPGNALAATVNTGDVLAGGGSSKQQGGTILVRSTATVSVGAPATIVSQGRHNGSGLVLLEGCGLDVRGLVASIADRGTTSAVTLRSGATIVVDGRDRSSLTGVRRGMLRADSPAGSATPYRVRVLARDAVHLLGPAGSLYALSANPGASNAGGGTIDVVSTHGSVTVSGNLARAGGTADGDSGGRIDIAAMGDVLADTAVIRANGDAPAGAGGAIALRSHSGSVSWQLGTGDVRPVGGSAGVPPAQQGTIALNYCTTVSTTGSSFPTDGSAPAFFPTSTATCSPAAPSIPPGETTLPSCNDAPVAANDAYSVAEGGTLNVTAPGVLANDVDAGGDAMTATLVSGPAHASSFVLHADGSFTYTHDGGETTSDSFTYHASDGAFDSNVATVTITVDPVNDVPVAADDAYTLAEGGTLHVTAPGVLTNDVDPDGPSEAAVLVSGPAHASSFTLDPNGEVLYIHDGSETASDSFTYKVDDGLGDSNVATVTLTIIAVDDTPVANGDSYSTSEGGALDVVAPGVLANDVDPTGAPLTATVVSGPAHAVSFTLDADGSFAYVHDGSETTTDSFTYRVTNGSAISNVATVTITVTPVNDTPVATDGAYAIEEGGTLTISAPGVLEDDSDPDDATLAAILVSGPAYAAFALNANGSFTYVHDGSETTSDTFTYTANDGSADSNVATVTITIAPVADAPVAGDDSYSVSEGGTLTVAPAGVIANDTDPDSSTLTAILVSGPAHATSFALQADGSFSYVHDGGETTSDSFTYRANDGALDSGTATVTITIAPQEDAPIANNDTYGVDEGGTLTVVPAGVLGNDSDADSATLTTVLVSGPAHASSFTLNLDGSFSYVHDGGETTSDSFTYKANDGAGDSNVATVTINVTAVNDAPAAIAHAGLPAQAGIRITYPAGKLGGTDVEPGTTITIDTTPVNVVNGSVVINANGGFVFTPLPAAAGGMASFQYRVSDNGNPSPGVSSPYVTVSFHVAGPAIYFTRSTPVGMANCTLGNECTVAGALANIGLSPNAHIFIGDAGTQTLASIALNAGGTIIGQGVQAASFDAFFGIVAPAQGTLAPRPLFNQNARPTLATTVILNDNSQVRGFNLTPVNAGLVATGRTGLAVSQLNITSDANLPSDFCVDFVNSSGTFLFGNIAVNAGRNGSGVNFNGSTSATVITFANVTMGGGGDAVVIANSGSTGFSFQAVSSSTGRAVDIHGGTGQFVFTTVNANGAATGILVRNATGSFHVNGVNGNPGTGGTIQNCTLKGADFRGSRNISLRGMNFLNNATVDGPGASCGRIDLSTTNNGPLNCNANLSLLSVTNVTLINLSVTGSRQIGIDGQSVNTLAMQGTTVAGNGTDAGEDGVQMSNLSGQVTLNVNNVFRDSAANLFEIVNDSGTMFASFSTSTFRYTTFNPAGAGSGLHIAGRGSAVINPFIGTSTFQNINASAVRVDLSGAASGTVTVGGASSGNTFTNNAQGMSISAVGTGTVNYSIRDNTLTNDVGVTSTFATTAISTSFGGAATRIGTIDNNTIGTNLLASPASGCFAAGCDGIQVSDTAATGTHRVTVSNNRVFHVNGAAIRVTSSGGSAETLRARISNNIANFPDNPASSASAIVVQDDNATPNGVFMTCLDVTGNQISGLWAAGTAHKSAIGIFASRAQQFALTTFNPATEYSAGAVVAGCTTECTGAVGFDGNAADFLSQQNPATVTAQSLSGGSSASQQRLTTSAAWAGTTGVCP